MKYGFLIINKPSGITSFDVVRQLRKILNIKKIGHLGTLDPLATGVLVVALGEATKCIEFLMKADKEYEAEIMLGSISNTYDAEGEITKQSEKIPTREEIIKVLKKFNGEIEQVPPVYSALKIKGKPAYSYARKGEEVIMKKRKINIYDAELLDYSYPLLSLRIQCSSGTYIRSIAHDIGTLLGTGAYLNGLKRTQVGDFLLSKSVQLDEISVENYTEFLVSIEDIAHIFPTITLTSSEYTPLSHGQIISKNLPNTHEKLFWAFYDDRCVGIVERVDKNSNIKFKKQLNRS